MSEWAPGCRGAGGAGDAQNAAWTHLFRSAAWLPVVLVVFSGCKWLCDAKFVMLNSWIAMLMVIMVIMILSSSLVRYFRTGPRGRKARWVMLAVAVSNACYLWHPQVSNGYCQVPISARAAEHTLSTWSSMANTLKMVQHGQSTWGQVGVATTVARHIHVLLEIHVDTHTHTHAIFTYTYYG